MWPKSLFLLTFLTLSPLGWASTATTLKECKSDWNQLLAAKQAQDSIQRVEMDSLRYKLEMETNKSTNYQESWKAMIQELHLCNQKSQDAEPPPEEKQLAPAPECVQSTPPPPTPTQEPPRSLWWMWLSIGTTLGAVITLLVTGIADKRQ